MKPTDAGRAVPEPVSCNSDQLMYKEGYEEADRENAWKTISESGLVLNGTSYCGRLRIARSGGSWLYILQWCPNGQPDYGTDEE